MVRIDLDLHADLLPNRLIKDASYAYRFPMRTSWNTATSRHVLLAASRHHRQVVGSDVNTDSNEHGDKAEPESPIMMRAPPVRSLAMAMMTLAVGMQVFCVVHHARVQAAGPPLQRLEYPAAFFPDDSTLTTALPFF
jgi:hypothetical protein